MYVLYLKQSLGPKPTLTSRFVSSSDLIMYHQVGLVNFPSKCSKIVFARTHLTSASSAPIVKVNLYHEGNFTGVYVSDGMTQGNTRGFTTTDNNQGHQDIHENFADLNGKGR